MFLTSWRDAKDFRLSFPLLSLVTLGQEDVSLRTLDPYFLLTFIQGPLFLQSLDPHLFQTC